MKMVKKILLGTLAVAAILSFASCKMGAGEGDTDGNKWNLTMTIDASDTASTPLAEGQTYRRFWKQFSSNEKCAALTTTITIPMKDWTYPDTKPASVVGLIFDLNANATDNKTVDFNLIGINPKTKKFYVERYTGITKQDKESLDTDAGSLVSALATPVDPVNLETASWAGKGTKDGFGYALADSMWSVSDDTATIKVTIAQKDKKYTVSLGDVAVAEYDASASTHVETIDKVDYAVGGIACYGNAGKGVKLTATYETDKKSVTGKLEAEEIEE